MVDLFSNLWRALLIYDTYLISNNSVHYFWSHLGRLKLWWNWNCREHSWYWNRGERLFWEPTYREWCSSGRISAFAGSTKPLQYVVNPGVDEHFCDEILSWPFITADNKEDVDCIECSASTILSEPSYPTAGKRGVTMAICFEASFRTLIWLLCNRI